MLACRLSSRSVRALMSRLGAMRPTRKGASSQHSRKQLAARPHILASSASVVQPLLQRVTDRQTTRHHGQETSPEGRSSGTMANPAEQRRRRGGSPSGRSCSQRCQPCCQYEGWSTLCPLQPLRPARAIPLTSIASSQPLASSLHLQQLSTTCGLCAFRTSTRTSSR